MTSFAKVCVDISNNLKNFRFSNTNNTPSNNNTNNSQTSPTTNTSGKETLGEKTKKRIPPDHVDTNNKTGGGKGFLRNSENFVDKIFDVYLNSGGGNCSSSTSRPHIKENRQDEEKNVLQQKQQQQSFHYNNNNNNKNSREHQYNKSSYYTTTTTFVNNNHSKQQHHYGNVSSTSSSPVIQRSKRSSKHHQSFSSHYNDCSQTDSDDEKFYNPYSETLMSSKQKNELKNQVRPSLIQMPPFSPTLSHRVYSLAQRVSELNSPKQRTGVSSACNSPLLSPRGATVNAIKQRLFNQGMRSDFEISNGFRMGTPSTKFRDYMRRYLHKKQVTMKNIFLQEIVMQNIFRELDGDDLKNCCLVCKTWLEFLMQKQFYQKLCLLLDFKQRDRFLTMIKNRDPSVEDIEMGLCRIIKIGMFRNINEICLKNLLEKDVSLLVNSIQLCKDFQDVRSYPHDTEDDENNETTKQIPPSVSRDSTDSNISENSLGSTRSSSSGIGSSLGSCGKILSSTKATIQEEANSCRSSISIKTIIPGISPSIVFTNRNQSYECKNFYDSLSIHDSSILDMSIEQISRLFVPLKSLELIHCNDISEICLWNILQPTITHFTIQDCINVSDESFAAICQLLPNLVELNIQAYHITNRAMGYFSKDQTENLRILRFMQCMEVSNQGFINLAQSLNNLTHLSLFGCSKLTDDGLDIICENFKMLEHLDLSWCVKLTDGGLECVACDLVHLRTLKLDKCMLITDGGLRHLSCMKSLRNLTLRWCCLLTDSGIIHILGISDLVFLSLAGCKGISSQGFVNLIKHKSLRIIELTNCPMADPITKTTIKQNINNCILIS